MNKTFILSLLCISSIAMKINCAAAYDPAQHALQQAIGRFDAPAVIAYLQANPCVTTATMNVLRAKIAQTTQTATRVNTFVTQSGHLLNRQQLDELEKMGEQIVFCNQAIEIILPLLTDAYQTTV